MTKLTKGLNDLYTVNPDLSKEWDYHKNGELTPSDVLPSSQKEVWWKCSKGHEWKAAINTRNKGRSCPYCSNRKVLVGFNDLQTVNPQLALEWDFERNGELSPQKVTQHSGRKVWWKCKRGHSWLACIYNRSKGTGCPVCKNKKIIVGYNNLSAVSPDLVLEWDFEKNGSKSPDDYIAGSEQKVWWKCKRGHSWYASIYHRYNGEGCPFCSNNRVLKGFNDLATVNPIIANEWNYEKNNGLTPSDFLPNSGKKVWWKCQMGHEWKTSVANRNRGTGCPVCSSEMKTSFPEQVCLYYFEKVTTAINRDNSFGKEIDILLPEFYAGIEYDGIHYHNSDHSLKKEQEKDTFFANKKIIIYHIKEGTVNIVKQNIIQYKVDYSYSSLNWAIYEVFRILGVKILPDINIDRDRFDIYLRYVNSLKTNSLAEKSPDIASEWDYEKNGNLTPEMVSFSSMKVVWWKCKRGHSWSSSVNNRNKAGCPVCSNRKLLIGYNDFQTVHPELVSEWDNCKNGSIIPNNIMFSSNLKVWWICKNGHSYEASVRSRSRGTGCPYCSNNRVLIGYNDLQTCNPQLALEWDYEKNGDLSPQMFTPHSGKKVWWICKRNHTYQASIDNRSRGKGCPICSNRIILPGFNDLETLNPTLADEWNTEKNGDLLPSQIGNGSHITVWWKCSMGHEWKASIVNRNRGTGCPFCKTRKIDF